MSVGYLHKFYKSLKTIMLFVTCLLKLQDIMFYGMASVVKTYWRGRCLLDGISVVPDNTVFKEDAKASQKEPLDDLFIGCST